MINLPVEFKKTLSEREINLAFQRFPSTETGIKIFRLVKEKYGVDIFFFDGGLENIRDETIEVVIDGERQFKFPEDRVDSWETLHGESADLEATKFVEDFASEFKGTGL